MPPHGSYMERSSGGFFATVVASVKRESGITLPFNALNSLLEFGINVIEVAVDNPALDKKSRSKPNQQADN